MLTEICSKAFRDDDAQRAPIELKQGLNVVMGPERASNSIGKTTFLLAVDFAFGGSSYASNDDILTNVGPHSLEFVHRICGQDYRFSRSVQNPSIVLKHVVGNPKAEEMSLEEFNHWLLRAYDMEQLDSSFRNLVGCFFRIYGKDNIHEQKPLKAAGGESDAKGVTRLMKLFGEYAKLEELIAARDYAKDEKAAFSSAVRHGLVMPAPNKTAFEENEKHISQLEAEKADLVARDHDNLTDLEPEVAERVSRLKRRLSALRRQRTRIMNRLASLGDGSTPKIASKKDFDKLSEFFPQANLKRFEDIEAFHRDIGRILKTEIEEAKANLNSALLGVNKSIEELSAEIKDAGSVSSITAAVLDSYASLQSELNRLKNANELYSKEKGLSDALRVAKDSLKIREDGVCASLETRINERLRVLNRKVCGPGISAPVIRIPSSKSYSFSIPNDSGTGSRMRGMFLFDFCLLQETPLPAIVEDSVTVKQVEDPTMINLLELFNSTEKQVFIAIDKASSYSDNGIPRIIEESKILELSRGHELFGRSWNVDTSENKGRSE